MRIKVTENGVLIPKMWLEGIDEVDIQQTPDMILVVSVHHGSTDRGGRHNIHHDRYVAINLWDNRPICQHRCR